MELQRPVDRISRNDSGSFATRQILADELARGNDRLAGKRVVVWEFAIRELALGNWKPIKLELGEVPEAGGFFTVPEANNAPSAAWWLRVDRRHFCRSRSRMLSHNLCISLISPTPMVRRFLMRLVSARSGSGDGAEHDCQCWQAPAEWQTGQRVRLQLQSWYDIEPEKAHQPGSCR